MLLESNDLTIVINEWRLNVFMFIKDFVMRMDPAHPLKLDQL